MYNKETCSLCGECLSECPFLEMSTDTAQEEIARMADEMRSDAVSGGCALCGYCDSICPTGSNPSALMREVLLKSNAEEGVGGLFLISKDVPSNFFSMALEFETDEKEAILERYENPPASSKMFYSGCALPYLFPDLTKAGLLKRYPVVGGMKFCCGEPALNSFGEEEFRMRGTKLLKDFKQLSIEKLITICTGCHALLSEGHPKVLNGFDIECQTQPFQGHSHFFLPARITSLLRHVECSCSFSASVAASWAPADAFEKLIVLCLKRVLQAFLIVKLPAYYGRLPSEHHLWRSSFRGKWLIFRLLHNSRIFGFQPHRSHVHCQLQPSSRTW